MLLDGKFPSPHQNYYAETKPVQELDGFLK